MSAKPKRSGKVYGQRIVAKGLTWCSHCKADMHPIGYTIGQSSRMFCGECCRYLAGDRMMAEYLGQVQARRPRR